METIAYDKVRLEIEAGLATITLDNPERLNAMSGDMVLGVINALQEVAKPRRAIRCLMLTGEGRGFCSGVDLLGTRQRMEQSQESGAKNLAALNSVETLFHPLVRRLRDVQVPVVAAVNGPCVGFGMAMALTADHIIASQEAYFLVPFRNLASCLDSGLSWLLPRAVGITRDPRRRCYCERLGSDRRNSACVGIPTSRAPRRRRVCRGANCRAGHYAPPYSRR
jgi:2-(1,2-epoxy-1,2-dihydrophenyl)acetyl-CoA isomerase